MSKIGEVLGCLAHCTRWDSIPYGHLFGLGNRAPARHAVCLAPQEMQACTLGRYVRCQTEPRDRGSLRGWSEHNIPGQLTCNCNGGRRRCCCCCCGQGRIRGMSPSKGFLGKSRSRKGLGLEDSEEPLEGCWARSPFGGVWRILPQQCEAARQVAIPGERGFRSWCTAGHLWLLLDPTGGALGGFLTSLARGRCAALGALAAVTCSGILHVGL